jgi:glycine cleavage system H protein
MEILKELHYTKDHEWVRVDASSKLTTGITDFAQRELGDIVFIELPAIGKQVKKGERLAVVESTKAASDIYAAVDGEVVQVNNTLTTSPELINSSPYKDGWIAEIAPTTAAQVEELMDATAYEKLIG